MEYCDLKLIKFTCTSKSQSHIKWVAHSLERSSEPSKRDFYKPFETPQSVKIKTLLNFYFNATFRKAHDVKG